MLQRVKVEGIAFPPLYMAETKADADLARQNGLPYVRWRWGYDELVRSLLRPVLEEMFPGIDWDKVLGKRRRVSSVNIVSRYDDDGFIVEGEGYDADEMLCAQLEHDGLEGDSPAGHDWEVADEDGVIRREVPIADGSRLCNGGSDFDPLGFYEDSVSVAEYMGDMSSKVDVEALQRLGLLPKFMGDVVDCIKHNLSLNMRWTEGYTKKLGYPLGRVNSARELPTLVIIDISASIPDGISATMLTLADTLRSQLNADLIITGGTSGWYPAGCDLPSPQTLRDYHPRGNEGKQFAQIVNQHVVGRKWGHVISFGDDDWPGRFHGFHLDSRPTEVKQVLHYHTWKSNTPTGYARWVDDVCPDADKVYDTSWCEVMNKDYRQW